MKYIDISEEKVTMREWEILVKVWVKERPDMGKKQ